MDELTRLLMAQIAGGEVPPATSLPDLLEQSLGDDPIAAPLAAALRQREAAAAGEDEEDDADVVADPEAAAVLERLYAEVESLRERTAALADAVGACARCWGDDELCPVCRGRGRPGGRQPDGALFEQYVDPAWRRHFGAFADELLLAPVAQSQPDQEGPHHA